MSEALLPRDVPTTQTLQFLSRFPLGERPRVLEVGCGAGDLALRLSRLRWQVLGIDTDAAWVNTARHRGVDAVEADLHSFESEPFDAVVVSRSLHHMRALDNAMDRLLRLVKPGGWLFLEEFDHAACDRPSAAWLYDRRDLLELAGALRGEGRRLELLDPQERWRREHPHVAQLHTGAAMRESVESRLKLLFTERAPYLYRYLTADLEPTERGHRLAQTALEQEKDAIEHSQIAALGLRLAARNED